MFSSSPSISDTPDEMVRFNPDQRGIMEIDAESASPLINERQDLSRRLFEYTWTADYDPLATWKPESLSRLSLFIFNSGPRNDCRRSLWNCRSMIVHVYPWPKRALVSFHWHSGVRIFASIFSRIVLVKGNYFHRPFSISGHRLISVNRRC